MSKEATFSFKGRDAGLSEALKTINKNVQNVSKGVKDAAKSINRFNLALTALKAVANAVGKVISVAFNTIKKLVSAGLNTLKSLISGTFKFIKSALSTLLSWTVKALGKVFDGVKKLFTNILNFTKTVVKQTTELVKKGVKTIIDSVQAYADKQYNEIQLKVSLGDSYDQVMKSFNKLLRYTTADKNDLLSVFATYAEVGKKPEEIEKYAKASIYMANATGQSLTRITRLLLGQEAAGTDLERVIHRLGLSISEQEQSISNIDKIIRQLEPEMEALSNNSLNQVFANVKNDIASIKEQIGQIFSGPVRYVAQSLDKLLTKLISSNKITYLTDKLQKVFDEHIKPVVDKIFEFLEKFILDPKGFFEALWADIKQIGQNFLDNLGELFRILGKVISLGIKALWEEIQKIDFSGALDGLTSAIENLVIGLGEGFGLWDDSDIQEAEGSLKKLFINSWNKAYPEFELKEDAKWYKNLKQMLLKAWDWAWTNNLKPKFVDPFIEKWNTYILPNLIDSFKLLGQVLLIAINNALADSPIIDLLNRIPGVKIGKPSDVVKYQETLYGALSAIPFGENGDTYASKLGLKEAKQITTDWLNAPNTMLPSAYGKTNKDVLSNVFSVLRTGGSDIALAAAGATIGAVATGGAGLVASGLVAGAGGLFGYNLGKSGLLTSGGTSFSYEEVADALESLKLFTHILEEREYPNFLKELKEIWKREEEKKEYHAGPTSPDAYKNLYEDLEADAKDISDKMGPLTDALRDFRSIIETPALGIKGFTVVPVYGGKGAAGGGGGGIQDYFSTSGEFKIKPYAKGGVVTKPTYALIGEAGPEVIIPLKNIPKLANADTASYDLGPNVDLALYDPSAGGKALTIWGEIAAELQKATTIMTKEVNNLSTWYDNAETLPDPVEDAFIEAHLLDNTWIDKLGRKIIRGVDYFFSGDWVDDVKDGLLKGADSLGAFLDSITNKIESLTWRDIKNGIAKLGEGVYSLVKQLTIGSFKGVGILAQNGGFGTHIGNIYNNAFNENGTFSIMKAFGALIQELLPYLQKGLEIIGPLFDQAFEILGSAVQILGERLGQQLLPILEAFIPLMKLLADIIVALAPVAESILKPAITVIAAILQALVPILEFLMPAFAGIGAVVQTVSESINWVIAKLLNWLASIDILGWRPFSGLGYRDPGTVHGVGENYRAIMSQYEAARANTSTGVATTSVGTAGQTASYSGSNHIYITNEFGGAYIVGGTGAFRELAKIIKAELEDMDYRGQTI